MPPPGLLYAPECRVSDIVDETTCLHLRMIGQFVQLVDAGGR
jgi:hypothetical protein